MASGDARPVPQKNVAYRVTFPIFDADGDLVTGAASLDSEVSKDGGTFADCTNEATEIATSSGMYYLDLTSTEMNADTVAVIVKTGTAGAKTTPIVLYPEEAGDIRVNVTQISGDGGAADNLEADYDGTGYNKSNSTIGTCTTNTDMRGTDSAATASALSTHDGKLDTAQADLDILTGTDGATLATSQPNYAPATATALTAHDGKLDTVDTNIDTLVTRVGVPANIDGGGATLSDNNKKFADDSGGTSFNAATDSLEAIRDRGDSAWITGAGGSDRLLLIDTTIASLSSQTSFTLTDGSADDDAYNNATIVVEDATTSTQKAIGLVFDYVGSTKTVTLKYDPGIFTMGTTDKVYILAENALKSTDQNRQLDVTANGNAGIDWANVENPSTAVDLSGTDIQLVDTCTTNTDRETMRGTDNAFLAANAPTNFPDMSITASTGLVDITQAAADKAWSTATRALTDKVDFALSTAGVQAIWDVLTTALTTANSIGKKISTFLSDIISIIESQRVAHTHQIQGSIFYVDPVNGDTHANGNRGTYADPYNSVQDCHDNAVVTYRHDCMILVSGNGAGATTLTEAVNLTKSYFFIRGPGRDFIWTRSGPGDTISVSGDGVELSGFQLETAASGSGNGISFAAADFLLVQNVWVNDTRGHGISLSNCSNAQITNNVFEGTGLSGAGHGISIDDSGGGSDENAISCNIFSAVQGDAIRATGANTVHTHIFNNKIHDCTGWGINIQTGVQDTLVIENNAAGNASGNFNDSGTGTDETNNSWDIDDILADTNETQTKLPTNNIMGSSDKTDKDDDIDAILVDTNEMQTKLPTNNIMGSSVKTDKDDDIDAILVDTAEMQGKLPTNNIMGSSVKTDQDDDIAAIKAKTDNLPDGIPKNTAYNNFMFFMADSADNITGKTGLSITSQRSIDGGAFGSTTNTATEVSLGYYKINLSAADLNGDTISFVFSGTGANTRAITIKTET
jgi:hypothetical protein